MIDDEEVYREVKRRRDSALRGLQTASGDGWQTRLRALDSSEPGWWAEFGFVPNGRPQ